MAADASREQNQVWRGGLTTLQLRRHVVQQRLKADSTLDENSAPLRHCQHPSTAKHQRCHFPTPPLPSSSLSYRANTTSYQHQDSPASHDAVARCLASNTNGQACRPAGMSQPDFRHATAATTKTLSCSMHTHNKVPPYNTAADKSALVD